jgi:hypothetical protein
MKNSKSILKKRNLFTIICNAGITLGIIALFTACPGSNDENSSNVDSIDSAKTGKTQIVDTAKTVDTTKTVDVKVK